MSGMTLEEMSDTMLKAVSMADDCMERCLGLQRELRATKKRLREAEEKLESARRTIRVLGGVERMELEMEEA